MTTVKQISKDDREGKIRVALQNGKKDHAGKPQTFSYDLVRLETEDLDDVHEWLAAIQTQIKRRLWYLNYLRSPEWADLREAAIERAGGSCQVCNSTHDLDAHHRTYERLGHEELADITVLCRTCHEKVHGRT